jgi:hypothetical protein
MSVQLATAVSSFISSVVVGKDMVPRLSLPAIHALLGDVVRAWRVGWGMPAHAHPRKYTTPLLSSRVIHDKHI